MNLKITSLIIIFVIINILSNNLYKLNTGKINLYII